MSEPIDLPGLFDLTGEVAFVTGASSGLGLHFARVLHEAGASVVFAARGIDRVAGEIAALGPRARGVALDVADEASIAAALDATERHFAPVSLLINNAGIAITRPFLDGTAEDWDTVLNTNLRGAYLMGQAAARRMVAAGRGGSIVNIASILGQRVIGGLASYTASKAGLLQLTRAMAIELARHNIRVNALAPGYVETPINAATWQTDAGKALIKRIPQRRLGTLADLTGPLLLLASPKAGAHLTGTTLTVDGGHSVGPV